MSAKKTKQTFTVELAGATTEAQLHDRLAASLPLPEYYGRNLDAFYDVLCEFGSGWRIVFRHAGAVATGLSEVCADAMRDVPGLEIVFEN